MNDHPECLAYGAIISIVVSMLKKVPLVKSHPKIAAAVLSTLSVVLASRFGVSHAEWATIARCVVETFATSVATHETVVQPVTRRLAD